MDYLFARVNLYQVYATWNGEHCKMQAIHFFRFVCWEFDASTSNMLYRSRGTCREGLHISVWNQRRLYSWKICLMNQSFPRGFGASSQAILENLYKVQRFRSLTCASLGSESACLRQLPWPSQHYSLDWKTCKLVCVQFGSMFVVDSSHFVYFENARHI